MRRELHRIPEFDMEVPETLAFIREKLRGFGLEPVECGGGLYADIRGVREGKTILLRADIDALHVQEETRKEYASVHPGFMHACGHDAHAAILLTAARKLLSMRDKLSGTVRLAFQPGEETGHGAVSMIAAGLLSGVDRAVSLHVGALAGPDYETGSLIIAPGAVSAGFEKFTVTVRGTGTHGAYPEKGCDALSAGAALVSAYQEIGFRELPVGTPAVIDIGSFHSGTDPNSIPGEAVLSGCIRSQDDAVCRFILKRMEEIGSDICRAFRTDFNMTHEKKAFPVVNDAAFAKEAYAAVRETPGCENVLDAPKRTLMAADDFGEYACRVPSLYFFLHTNNPEKGIEAPNHSGYFDMDEDCLMRGVLAETAIAERFLN